MTRADRLDPLDPSSPAPEDPRGGRSSLLGYRVLEMAEGRSRVEWTPTREIANHVGQVHGGFLGVIVDDVAGCALASLITRFRPFPTASMQLEFHRPIPIGQTVSCRGTVVRIGRRFAVVDVVVTAGGGRLLARGTATFVVDTADLTHPDGRPLAGFSALAPDSEA